MTLHCTAVHAVMINISALDEVLTAKSGECPESLFYLIAHVKFENDFAEIQAHHTRMEIRTVVDFRFLF
jgi:hypothetical protein